MTTDKQAPVARHWIDGHWCDSAKHQDSFDPATGEKIGSYAAGGADEAREAVAAVAPSITMTAPLLQNQSLWLPAASKRSIHLHEGQQLAQLRLADPELRREH